MAYDTDYYTNAYLVLEGYEKEMIPASETKAVINFNPLGIPTVMPAAVKLGGLFEEEAPTPPTQPEVPPGGTDTTIETGGCEESSATLTAEGEAALGVLAAGGGLSSFKITTGGTGGGTGGY